MVRWNGCETSRRALDAEYLRQPETEQAYWASEQPGPVTIVSSLRTLAWHRASRQVRVRSKHFCHTVLGLILVRVRAVR